MAIIWNNKLTRRMRARQRDNLSDGDKRAASAALEDISVDERLSGFWRMRHARFNITFALESGRYCRGTECFK
jgi:hypothetical protein